MCTAERLCNKCGEVMCRTYHGQEFVNPNCPHEEEGDDEQEYLVFDTEPKDDLGRYIMILLIVQYKNGIEWVFEGGSSVIGRMHATSSPP